MSQAPRTRFIILGQQRTGSNLVVDLLNQHPDAVVFGEVFSSRQRISWGVNFESHRKLACPDAAASVPERNADPIAFLLRYVYGDPSKAFRAVGFKLFYENYSDRGFGELRAWLTEQRDVFVIHLKRMNVLRTLLSKRRAGRSRVWTVRAGSADAQTRIAEADQPIELRASDCDEFFERTLMAERDADFMFRFHRKLDIYYEDLAKDPGTTHLALCAFLGLAPSEAAAGLMKQTRGSLPALISNYAELKERFAAKHARAFFDE